jgi:mRNA interferase MazF
MTRGDLFELRPPKSRGHEQQGPRYGVVLQSTMVELSTVIVAPTSASAPRRSFRPEVEIEGERTRVQVEQLRAVSTDRLGDLVGHLAPEELQDVDHALRLVLGLY